MRYATRRTKTTLFTLTLKCVAIVIVMLAGAAQAKMIFKDNFDGQPDYTSSDTLNLTGWTHRRNGEDIWAYPSYHDAFEILASNSEKARGGSGKAFVAWRESYALTWKNWNSDGILARYLEAGYDQLYVSFWIRFSPEWTKGGLSKMFRIYSWDSTSGEIFNFSNPGYSGPIVLWDYTQSADYGLRNTVALRGGQHGENYEFYNGDIPGLPRQMSGIGDLSLNFTTDTVGMSLDGETPKIVDKVNGGYISDNMNQTVVHEQVFGEFGEWTKMAFYVKMNSAPNVKDGALIQWINDVLVFRNHNIPWVRGDEHTEMVKWNVVAIGGNDFFRTYDNALKHEEWYAIDDVEIHDSLPTAGSSSTLLNYLPAILSDSSIEQQ